MASSSSAFPRQTARTRGFTLGVPRQVTVAADGSRVVFLRSSHGEDPRNALWVLDVADGAERMVADPGLLLGGLAEQVPAAERARRERTREVTGGFVAYSTDPSCTTAVAALGGRLYLVDLVGGDVEPLDTAPEPFDPRLSPTAERVAYVAGRGLRIVERGGGDRVLVESDDPDVSWGSADFVASEEIGRTRGHWWSPDGGRLAVARVDVGPVDRWHIADPADPAIEPVTIRYPAAGTANALVGLAILDLDGRATPIEWDAAAFPYLVDVDWTDNGLLVTVQSRDQRILDVLRADPDTGTTSCRLRQEDECWVDVVPGTPTWLDERLVTTVDHEGTRRLAIDGKPVSPSGVQVRSVHADGAGRRVFVTGSDADPTVVHTYQVGADGSFERLTDGEGVRRVLGVGGDVLVLWSDSMDGDGPVVEVLGAGRRVAAIASHRATPVVRPLVRFGIVGDRRLRTALLLPSDGVPDRPLPVLLDPYGGPHVQRVLRSSGAYLTSQWFADQGFAVVIVDGRGTPGRGPAWEREVRGDLAGPVLDDQVDALLALAGGDDRLDLTRVAIRGWSFGGYLAALAVLRRPDVFHAAVAGAPVTDWALYDTHYTERYLGRPAESPEAYRRSSIIEDAARLERPLLLIHGLADDNVVVAHTLRLSRALLEAGRPHQVLPLSRITHMTAEESVAENLLRLQVLFLREALLAPTRDLGPGAGNLRSVDRSPDVG